MPGGPRSDVGLDEVACRGLGDLQFGGAGPILVASVDGDGDLVSAAAGRGERDGQSWHDTEIGDACPVGDEDCFSDAWRQVSRRQRCQGGGDGGVGAGRGQAQLVLDRLNGVVDRVVLGAVQRRAGEVRCRVRQGVVS